MRFKVLKSSFYGICGSESSYESLDEAMREICYSKGWDSLEQLHKAIRKWGLRCKLGDVFSTQASAIVAVGVSALDREDGICHHCWCESLEYGELSPVEGGNVQQEAECTQCGKRWMDVFVLADQRELVSNR